MKDLHKQFVKLGRERNQITYKLLALLPKIFEQKIHEKHGFDSIYEYAGKLAGLSHWTVEKALNLEKKLENKPCLQKAIETQGIHKVSVVANLATPETDKALADKVENMSMGALLELRKEIRGNKQETIKIELDSETQKLFFKLKKKLGGGISNKKALKKMLEQLQEEPKKTRKSKGTKEGSRPISASRKREAGDQCAFPGCNKPAEIFHHRERFSENQSHDSVVALCREHHEYAHNGLIANEYDDPSAWKMNLSEAPTEQSDLLYRKYRQVALL